MLGALTAIGGEEVIDAFIELLDADSWTAHGDGLPPPPGFPPPWWPDGPPRVIEALGALKAERAVPTIVKVLEEKGPGRAYLGSVPLPVLAKLDDPACIPALRRIGEDDPRTMCRDLDSPDRIKAKAAEVMRQIASKLG